MSSFLAERFAVSDFQTRHLSKKNHHSALISELKGVRYRTRRALDVVRGCWGVGKGGEGGECLGGYPVTLALPPFL